MSGKDSYIERLATIILASEEIYGLTATNGLGVPYSDLDVTEVVKLVGDGVVSLSKEEIYRRNVEVGKHMVLLAYLSTRLRFFGKVKLDYSVYPCMDVVANTLLSFTKKEMITQDILRELNKTVLVLSEVDYKFVNHRCGLGYRFLRLFLIMALYGSYCNASIIAVLILDQLITNSEGT